MNQRQWIQMDDTTSTSAQKIARISWSIVAVATAAALVVGLAFGIALQLAVPVAIAAYVFARSIRSTSDSYVRSDLDTREASETDQARIFNVVDGLCVVSGDHRPHIEVIDSEFPVAVAFGNATESSIVVSNGFCTLMDRVETEAVMAHLLWRIRSGDAELTAYLLHLVAKLSRVGLGSLARSIVTRVFNSQAILWADIAACQATRYPPALASALEKVGSSSANTAAHLSFPLWFATPQGTPGATHEGLAFPSLGVSYPSLADRIGVLKEI